jgi:hypothetical protein
MNDKLTLMHGMEHIEIAMHKLVGHVARMREKINAFKFWIGNPEGKRLLGRRRYRWEDDVMDLRGLKWM